MQSNKTSRAKYLVGNDDLDINTGIDGDVGELSHDLRGGVKVEDALVDAHLEAIEGVGTLTTRRLADQELEDLGGHADGAGHLQVLLQSLVLELGAHLLDGLHVSGGQGDADAVDHIAFGIAGLNSNWKQRSEMVSFRATILTLVAHQFTLVGLIGGADILVLRTSC